MRLFLQLDSYNTYANDYGGFAIMIVLAIGAILYFLPTIIAFVKNKPNKIAIGALNFFLGWSMIGWVIALVWSLSSNTPSQPIIVNSTQNEDEYDKLNKLRMLRDNGTLSQEEFEQRKRQILG